ncbi:MAG: hypothetical protein KDK70_04135 [Myxococcales bacterium]|nr:hypothetical protein [Myxococcales bacterium]
MKSDRRANGWVRRVARGLGTLGLGALVMGCYVGTDEAPVAQPRSLQGVEVDGALTVTSRGDFVFDAGARALFDHFLAAEGEVDDASLHARVRQEIDLRLAGQDAAEQAWDAFVGYVEYRHEVSALAEHYAGSDPHAALEPMLEQLGEIRASTIGDVPGVPDDGPRLRAALTARAALEDPQLDPAERTSRLTALRADLGQGPEPEAPSRILSRIHAALESIPADDVEARRAVLTELAGDAAAERWLALERRRVEALAAEG